MEISSKQPERFSMTCEEEEEMKHDISKLQDQVQQISFSLKVNEAKMNGVEANMNGMHVKMEAKMDGMETKINGMDDKMEELKINLNKLLQEMVTNCERVVKETHDENKRNVSHDYIDSNVGLMIHHVPKIEMRKFDGKDLETWILQMEQFFDILNVKNTQKVRIATLYLEPNQFVWYRWLCFLKQIFTWAIFTEEIIAHYEDTKSNTFFSQLINLKQKGSMMEHIEEFQKLNIRINDILEKQRIDVFIGTLKDNIQHEVHLWEPDSLEKAFRWERKIESELWKQGIPPLTTIIMEVFLLLAFDNLQGLHHNNWKKKEKKGFVTIVIENALKVISVLRRNYFT